jgi:hypothetical protein
MRLLAALGLLVASPALAASAAHAAAPGPSPSARQSALVREITIPVRVEGGVEVEFRSAAANGCDRPCDVSGALTWSPTSRADLTVNEYRRRRARELEASLVFFGGLGQDAPRTTAHVVRERPGGPGLCSDARVDALTFIDFSAGSGSFVDARLLRGEPDDANLFRSRCGGPLERDLAGVLPSAKLSRATLMRGGATVDLSATRPFAVGGFAGTVRSTVKLRLDRAHQEPPEERLGPPRPSSAPRTVVAVYDLEEVSGSVVTSFTGGAERSLCEPLDSCGSSGTVRISPRVAAGRATFAAFGPARQVSGRQLRTALGLRPGPLAPGISASGVAEWTRDDGSVVQSFVSADGTACSDTVPLAGGFMTFYVGPRRVFASYGSGSGGGPDPLRTHCPGPSILDAALSRPLATGAVPRRAFRNRRVVITLPRGRPFASEPYAGDNRPALRIVLRRVRVRETRSPNALGAL